MRIGLKFGYKLLGPDKVNRGRDFSPTPEENPKQTWEPIGCIIWEPKEEDCMGVNIMGTNKFIRE